MRKVNYTILFETEEEADNFEVWIRQFEINIIDYVKFPNTEHLKDNETFKKLIKAKRDAGRELDRYINQNRK